MSLRQGFEFFSQRVDHRKRGLRASEALAGGAIEIATDTLEFNRQKRKTPQSARLGGVIVRSKTGFASITGGDEGIRTLETGFARLLP